MRRRFIDLIVRLALLMIIVCFSGCSSNSDVESLVYIRCNGQILCPYCKKPNPHYKENDTTIHYDLYPYVPSKCSKWIYANMHAIVKVHSKKGVEKDIWIVTIESKCSECPWQTFTVEEEYSFRRNKLRFLRTINRNPDFKYEG